MASEDINLTAGLDFSDASLKAAADKVSKVIESGAKKGVKALGPALQELAKAAYEARPGSGAAYGTGQAAIKYIQQFQKRFLQEGKNGNVGLGLELLNTVQALRTNVVSPARSELSSKRSLKTVMGRLESYSQMLDGRKSETTQETGANLMRSAIRSASRLAIDLGDEDASKKIGSFAAKLEKYDTRAAAKERADKLSYFKGEANRWIAEYQRTDISESYKEAARQKGLGAIRGAMGLATTPELVEEISELSEALKRNTKTVDKGSDQFVKAALNVTKMGITGAAHYVALATASRWREGVTADIYASAQARVDREKAFAGTAGTVVGAAIGGALGSIVPGGTLVGGAIGGTVGGEIGKLFGEAKQVEQDRKERTRKTMAAMRKDYYTYGGTGFSLGRAMEQSGLASASSVNQMRWTGETLAGAMAFGMVGEQDMLMLSLMPEYFNALMSGASTEEQLAAYKRSADRLPPQLRALVASSAPGGSVDLYGATRDPMFNKMIAAGGIMSDIDLANMQLSNGWASASNLTARDNQLQLFQEMYRDTRVLARYKQDRRYYTPEYAGAIGLPTNVALNEMTTPDSVLGVVMAGRQKNFFGPNPYLDGVESNLDWASELRSADTEKWDGAREAIMATAEALKGFNDKEITINVHMNQGDTQASTTLTQGDIMTQTQINIVGSTGG